MFKTIPVSLNRRPTPVVEMDIGAETFLMTRDVSTSGLNTSASCHHHDVLSLDLSDVPHILLTFPRASSSADQWLHHSGRLHLPEGQQRWTLGEGHAGGRSVDVVGCGSFLRDLEENISPVSHSSIKNV